MTFFKNNKRDIILFQYWNLVKFLLWPEPKFFHSHPYCSFPKPYCLLGVFCLVESQLDFWLIMWNRVVRGLCFRLGMKAMILDICNSCIWLWFHSWNISCIAQFLDARQYPMRIEPSDWFFVICVFVSILSVYSRKLTNKMLSIE